MRSLWLANGVNLVLDPCLIFGLGPVPELGITGAAIGTTVGRSVGVLYQILCLRARTGRIRVKRPHVRFEAGLAGHLLRVSVGGILQFFIATASWLALVRILTPFGAAALAGYTIALRIIIVAILPSWGMTNAVATLVGQNLGAGVLRGVRGTGSGVTVADPATLYTREPLDTGPTELRFCALTWQVGGWRRRNGGRIDTSGTPDRLERD